MAKSLQETYCSEVRKQLNYFAAWMPNIIFKPGDFGTLSGNLFSPLGSLTDLGVSFEVGQRGNYTHFAYQSSSVKTSQLQSTKNVSGIQPAKSGLKIEFGAENACFMRLRGCVPIEIVNIQGVDLELLRLREIGQWQDEWAYIFQVQQTEKTLIGVSSTKNGSL